MFGRLYLISLAYLFSCAAFGQDLQHQWQALYQEAWQQTEVTIKQSHIAQFPKALWLSSSQYPNFERYSWQDLRALEQVATDCRATANAPQHISGAIEFQLALCQNKQLDPAWFANHTLLHPAGGSYADRYLEQGKAHNQVFSPELLAFTSLSNPNNPLYSQVSTLSAEGKQALINGYRAWLEGDALWLSGESGWKRVTVNVWQPLAKHYNITLTGNSCGLNYSNLCISHTDTTWLSQQQLLLLFGTLVAVFIARLSVLKHKQQREKRFVLQLLTHELRTPITSLGLTIELFRDQFDQFDSETQQAFWRLLADYQRLSQLTENSKVYLNANKGTALLSQTASVHDWLSHCCDKHQVEFSLNQDKEITLPYYWLSVCLDNLLKNAKQHGQGEVYVSAHLGKTLTIEVQDQGHFPNAWQRMFRRKKASSDNMGIGLHIVVHLIKLANGKLILLRKPTRCILELPYEHNTSD